MAASLAVGDSDEVQLRASVSRAYYAAFHSVLPLVQQFPRSKTCPKEVGHVTHKELTSRLNEWQTDSVHPKLARMTTTRNTLLNAIELARAARVKADYMLGTDVDLAQAIAQVNRARRIIQAMAQIEGELKRPAA
ncbi:hypothetical protein JI752_019085 [Lysobacter sp. MMG2]|uniref:hypothetical protein n=1 Tax=Lysobacter sp. MMG2 TaxID=2801338 RepID=UPI001C224A8A|nr:hypothetical protein [Lysobacter sp. MMG2]MBU8978256.1 hypothetical protein [Lysobacter sp. MMG2]